MTSSPTPEFSREDWIAAVRAEIEREGIHVEVTDDELWEAIASPTREARLRHLRALVDLGPVAKRATAAMERFAEAFREGESIDQARWEIRNLPQTPDERQREAPDE